MAKIERPKGLHFAFLLAPLLPTLFKKSEANRRKGVKSSPPPKIKNYLLHYSKGKYYLINLSLKKKGHEQKYL